MAGTSKKELRGDRNSIEISRRYKNEIKIFKQGTCHIYEMRIGWNF